jgi:group I intron endonuclease
MEKLPRTSGIYTITNIINNKIYIGYTINFLQRWSVHKHELKRNIHHNIHLQNAWNKYGEEAFEFEILEECEEQFLVSEEHYWCTILNTHNDKYGYNDRPTNPYNKIVWTMELRTKLSNSMKISEKHKTACNCHSIKMTGRKRTKESIDNQIISRKRNAEEKGFFHSKEVLNKISEGNKGKKRSKQTIKNLIIAKQKQLLKDNKLLFHMKNISKMRDFTILCIYKNGLIEEFESIKYMSIIKNISLSSLRNVSKKRYKNYKNLFTIIKKKEYDENFDYNILFT